MSRDVFIGWLAGLVLAAVVSVGATTVADLSNSGAFVVGLGCGTVFPLAGMAMAIFR